MTDAVAPFRAGGREQRTAELSRRLVDRFDVHVHTVRWWGPGTRREDGVVFRGLGAVHPADGTGRRSIRRSLAFALSCLRLLVARVDVLTTDHAPYLHLPVLALVARLRRTPLVVTWHEVRSRSAWCDRLGALGVLAAAFERRCLRLPDLVVAASAETGLAVGGLVRTPVVVAPNGVDLSAIRSALAEGDFPTTDVVTVGRLLPHKRVGMLLDALAALGPAVSARVIGHGPERELLTARAAELGLDVTVHSDVADASDLYRLVAGARVFVLPSAREGFGVSALEAVACGLPVVTTAAPDNLARHLVAEAPGGIVCGDDVAALTSAVRRALDAPPDRGDADAWLALHGWAATADRVAAALFSVLPRGSAPLPDVGSVPAPRSGARNEELATVRA